MEAKISSILQEKAYGTFKRNQEIRKLAKKGWSFARIARKYSLSRQAVWAIVKKPF